MSHTYETYTDTAGEHRWRLTHENGEIVGASSEGFSSEAEANKNAWRVVSGLTVCLGVTDGSASAPQWLYDGIAKLQHDKPERWAEVMGAFRTMLDIFKADLEGVPPELVGNIDRILADFVGPDAS